MSAYPEHEKLSEIQEQSQRIGLFLEWLRQQGYVICRWEEPDDDLTYFVDVDTGEPCERGGDHYFHNDCIVNTDWYEEGYYPTKHTIQDILAEYFDIDQKKLEAEKRAMLAEVRRMNE